MSGWERVLREAVEPLGMPCAQISYGGTERRYLVFNHSATPVNFGDDVPWHERVWIQLHLFADATDNTVTLRRRIKRDVHDAGFTYPQEIDASDKDAQHIVFEFETIQASEVLACHSGLTDSRT